MSIHLQSNSALTKGIKKFEKIIKHIPRDSSTVIDSHDLVRIITFKHNQVIAVDDVHENFEKYDSKYTKIPTAGSASGRSYVTDSLPEFNWTEKDIIKNGYSLRLIVS